VTDAELRDLQKRLASDADRRKRDWWTRYLKGEAAFRGTPMSDVRRHVHAWWEAHGFDASTQADRLGVPLALLGEPLSEDKLAGILLLGERFVPGGWLDPERDLLRLAAVFDDGDLADWNVVDWFCVKVLGPWVASLDGTGRSSRRAHLGRAIAGWRDAPVLWRRRASAVAFVNLVKRGDAFFDGFVDEVVASCAVLIRSDERFAQTGAGWVLRELSVAEPERVRRFLDEHGDRMSSEARRSAGRKLET
jgi:hypothetical protein